MRPLSQLSELIYVGILSVACILLLTTLPALAQDQIIFHGGDNLTGKIIEEQPDKILFQTDNAIIGISRSAIKDIITAKTISFTMGENYYSRGLYKFALKHYQTQLSQYPQTPVTEATLYKIGLCYLKIGDYTKAISTFNNYLKQYPEGSYRASSIYQIGNIYYLQKSYSEAISFYKTFLVEHPDSKFIELALYNIAKSYLATGNNDKAIEHFQKLIAKFPESKNAEARFFLLKTTPDIEAYKNYITTYPNSPMIPEAIANLSQFYFQKDAYNDFTDYLISLKKNKSIAYLSSVSYYLALSRWRYLEWCAARSATIDNWDDYNAVKKDYLNQIFKETQKAVELSPHAEIAIEAQYLNWQVHAFLYDKMKDQAYQKFIELLITYCDQTKDPAKLKEIADRLCQKFKYDYAKGIYQNYATNVSEYLEPTEAIPILLSLTEECLKKFKQKTAKKIFDQYEETLLKYQGRTKTITILKNLANKNFQKKNYLFSQIVYEKLRDRYSSNFNDKDCFRLSLAYKEQAKHIKAIEGFKTLTKKYPKSEFADESQYLMADSYEKLSKYSEAVTAYYKIIDSYPASPFFVSSYDKIRYLYYHYTKDKENLVGISKKIAERFPAHKIAPLAQYRVGFFYYLKGDYDTAIEEYQKVVERYPESQWASPARYRISKMKQANKK